MHVCMHRSSTYRLLIEFRTYILSSIYSKQMLFPDKIIGPTSVNMPVSRLLPCLLLEPRGSQKLMCMQNCKPRKRPQVVAQTAEFHESRSVELYRLKRVGTSGKGGHENFKEKANDHNPVCKPPNSMKPIPNRQRHLVMLWVGGLE